jgi:acyl transferase domain-containing protein
MGQVAIVGMDCRFPGAPDPAGYWDLLTRSGDGTCEVPRYRWDAGRYFSPDGGPGLSNTTRGGFIDDADAFDDDFFTVSPREAAAMDPQQRLLLQTAWRAVEDAGIAPRHLAGSNTGVFIGVMGNEWARLSAGDYATLTPQEVSGNGYCMAANRISYHLDLKGQSLAVDTACSSSLVAVHLAGNALLSGECDYALAGGVNLAVTPALNIFYTQTGLSAPDGRCKPFRADADGIGRSEGVGVVVLRRLEDALAAGQRVYAVVRGTAVNQDGRSNGITAPNRWSQREVIAAACRRAGVEPAEVDFLEAHGTGTRLGDRIEANALGDLHAGRTGPRLPIGSVKGNLGHAEGAAGIAGLIKAALALHYRLVPASRLAAREDPALGLAERGLRLLKSPLLLRPGASLAGVSSFGLGGTNAHAVLASAPAPVRAAGAARAAGSAQPAGGSAAGPEAGRAGIGAGVFSLTAASPDSLRENLLAQADAVERLRGSAAGVCWASNEVKTGNRYRYAVAAGDGRELAAALRTAALDPTTAGVRRTGRARVAFLYTGQGSQFPGMTAGLLREAPLYRRFLLEADTALRPFVGAALVDLIAGADPRIHRTDLAQPALFAVEYALGRMFAELGVEPAMVLGHSLGEYAAACLADVFPLEAAARLVAARSSLMGELPSDGGMLQVRAGAPDLAEFLEGEPMVAVGAFNGPNATVVSGRVDVLGRIAAALAARGVRTRPLEVAHAFHSPLMEPMIERFAETAREIGGGVPKIPVYSTVRGRLLRDEPMDADYWVEHVRRPVRFSDAATALLSAGRPTALVEIGPRPILGPLVERLGARPRTRMLHPVPQADSGGAGVAAVIAELYRRGADPVWPALYDPGDRDAGCALAPYVFSTAHRYWDREPVAAAPAPPDPQAGRGDDVWDAVVAAIAQVGNYAPGLISARSRLYEDLGFDSVMVMELKDRLAARLASVHALSTHDLLPAMATAGDLAEFLRAPFRRAVPARAGTA